MNEKQSEKGQVETERNELLVRLESWLEGPMIFLGFIWLILLVIELTRELSPLLRTINYTIWVIFLIDFLLKFTIAPKKIIFLKQNTLTVISLFLPALRVLRIFRTLRFLRLLTVTRGVRLIQVISAINRGMRSLSASMNRRGAGYVLTLTLIVIFAGAAGMYAFENKMQHGSGLSSYGEALWWTAMLMTSIGSEYWPQTPEGRILCFILSLYSLGVLGYITAALATFFVESDAGSDETEIAGSKAIHELQNEIAALRVLLEEKNM